MNPEPPLQRSCFLLVFLAALLFSFLFLLVGATGVEARTWTVDDDPGANFSSIQDAVNASQDGDSIRVWDGSYEEFVVVNKTLSIIGNGSQVTIIEAQGSVNGVYVESPWSNLSGFGVNGSSSYGVDVRGDNARVWNLALIDCGGGVHFSYCDGGYLGNSSVEDSQNYAIYLYKAGNTTVENTSCVNSRDAFWILDSQNCSFFFNYVEDTEREGLRLANCYNMEVLGFRCVDALDYGLYIWNSKLVSLVNTSSEDCQDGLFLFSTEQVTVRGGNYQNSSHFGLTAISCHWSNVSDIGVSGTLGSGLDGDGVYLRDCQNLSLQNVSSHESGYNGFKLENCANVTILGGEATENMLDGFLVLLSENCRLEGVFSAENLNNGITVEDSQDIVLESNNCSLNQDRGIRLEDGIGHRLTGNEIYRNQGRGIDLLRTENCLLENNRGLKSSGPDIFVRYDIGSVLRNNSLESRSSYYTVYIHDGCRSTIFHNNSLSASLIVRGTTGVVVTNNTIRANSTFSFLDTCTDLWISGNRFEGTGIRMMGMGSSYWATHQIDTSNTVDGKPIRYFTSRTGLNITGETGQLILADCQDSVVSGLNISSGNTGIQLGFCRNITVQDCEIGSLGGIGIRFYATDDSLIRDCEIRDCDEAGVDLELSDGIQLLEIVSSENREEGLKLLKSDSVVASMLTLKENQIGIYANDCARLTIGNSTAFNNQEQGIYTRNSDDVWVFDSQIVGNGDNGVEFYYSTDAQIITCNSSENQRSGISLYYSEHARINRNHLWKNVDEGVSLKKADNGEFRGNTISSGNYGIYLNDPGGNLDISGNRIFGNLEYGIFDEGPITRGVKGNWWGDASGPYHPTENPNGKGDNVSDKLVFNPWVRFEYLMVHNQDSGSSYFSIQEAVDEASPGDTIRVWEGMFVEEITIDKPLNLIGNGSSSVIACPEGVTAQLELESDWVNVSGFTVDGLGISQIGVFVQGDHFRLEELNCKNTMYGIRILDCSIGSVRAVNSSNNSVNGLYLDWADNITVSDCVFRDNEDYGIILHKSYDCLVENNSVSGAYSGIYLLTDSESNIVRNNHCSGNTFGLYIESAGSNLIIENQFQDGEYGIYVVSQFDEISIFGNNCSNNSAGGIYLRSAVENARVENNSCLSNGEAGIQVRDSQDCYLANNSCLRNNDSDILLDGGYRITMKNNHLGERGLVISSEDSWDWDSHDIGPDNTVDGKPLYYYKNAIGVEVPRDAGQVIIVSSQNMVVRNLDLEGLSQGITVVFSSGITITDCELRENLEGFYLKEVQNSSFSRVTIFSPERRGVYLDTCEGLYFSELEVTGAGLIGIHLRSCVDCIFSHCRSLGNNESGFDLGYSHRNLFISCELSGNGDSGFNFGESDENMVLASVVSNNRRGIFQSGNSTQNEVYYCNIQGNEDFGINVWDFLGNPRITATYNYWGSDTGPYHPYQNPDGDGESVTDRVDFDFWESAPFTGNIFIGSLSGRITDERENPLPGVKVQVQVPTEDGFLEAFSNESGYYRISGLPLLETALPVEVTAPGFVPNVVGRFVGEETIYNLTLPQANVSYVWSAAPPGGDGSWSAPYTTINEALIGAEEGAVIYLWEGFYNEQVLITTSLSLLGNSSEECLIFWTSGNVIQLSAPGITLMNVSVRGSSSSAGVLVQEDGSHISNLSCQLTNHGIYLSSSDNHLIENNNCSMVQTYGIHAFNSHNSVIRNNNCSNSLVGIRLWTSGYNLVHNNSCFLNTNYGIELHISSTGNLLEQNSCLYSGSSGIYISTSNDNLVRNNNCSFGDAQGIWIYLSSDDSRFENNSCLFNQQIGILITGNDHVLVQNLLMGNGLAGVALIEAEDCVLEDNVFRECGLAIEGSSQEYWDSHQVRGNLVNGRPLYFYKGGAGFNVPEDAGQLFLVDCGFVGVSGLDIQEASVGISVAFSQNIILSSNRCDNNSAYGIYVGYSSHCRLDRNTASSNPRTGIYLYFSSDCVLGNNTANRNGEYGIYLGYSSDNWLDSNVMSGNKMGLHVVGSSTTRVTGNVAWNNIIFGNIEYGIYVSSTYAFLDARYCWWGDQSGPYQVGTNPGGTGDNISNYMSFNPWETQAVGPLAYITSITPSPATTTESVRFLGLAVGEEEAVSYRWYSDIDGLLYEGVDPAFSLTGLSSGGHTISFQARDRKDFWSQVVTTALLVHTRPVATIVDITPSLALETDTLRFQGSGEDDGDIQQLVWYTDQEELYNGSSSVFTKANLSVGSYTVYLKVRDNYGAWSLPAQATLVVEPNGWPVAGISDISPSNPGEGDTVRFTGSGSDDGSIIGWRWVSNKDGILAVKEWEQNKLLYLGSDGSLQLEPGSGGNPALVEADYDQFTFDARVQRRWVEAGSWSLPVQGELTVSGEVGISIWYHEREEGYDNDPLFTFRLYQGDVLLASARGEPDLGSSLYPREYRVTMAINETNFTSGEILRLEIDYLGWEDCYLVFQNEPDSCTVSFGDWRWTMNIDEEGNARVAGLSPGQHIISFSAQDDLGVWSQDNRSSLKVEEDSEAWYQDPLLASGCGMVLIIMILVVVVLVKGPGLEIGALKEQLGGLLGSPGSTGRDKAREKETGQETPSLSQEERARAEEKITAAVEVSPWAPKRDVSGPSDSSTIEGQAAEKEDTVQEKRDP